MDLSTTYPQLAEFQARINEQQNGIGYLCLMCVVAVYYLSRLRARYPIQTRIGGAALYLVSLVAAGGGVFLGAMLFLTGLGWAWHKTLTRIPPLLLIMVLGLLLRLPMMNEGIWYDEAFTVGVASAPDMWDVIRADVHPPLWYMIEAVVIRVLGNGEAAIRLPSLLLGMLAILLTWRLCYELDMSERGRYVAALLVAVSGAHLYYSNEARGYMLLCCAVLTMALAIKQNRSWLFAGAVAIACYTHNIGYVYVGLLSLYALYQHRNLAWGCKIFAVAVIGALWLPSMAAQSKDIADGFWMGDFNPNNIPAPFLYMTVGIKIPHGLTLIIAAAVYGMTIASICLHWRWLIREPLLAIMVFGVPTFLALVSLLWRDVYLERAMLPVGTVLLILWSKALTEGNKGDSRALALMIIPALFITTASHYNPEYGKSDSNAIAAMQAACQNRTAYTTTINVQFIAVYYLPRTVLWTDANDLTQTLPLQAKQALGWQLAAFEDVPAGEYCILDGWNELSRIDERGYMQSILDRYPHTTRMVRESDLYTTLVHVLVKP